MLTRRPKILGLTGGIGSGKSTVAAIFNASGVPVLSADIIAKEILQPGEPALLEIAQKLGADLIGTDGHLMREALRAKITKDPSARVVLDSITHPKIQERSKQLMDDLLHKGAIFVLYEAPLLFEANSQKRTDAVICVIAPDDLRVARVMTRDGVTQDAAEALLRAQMPQEEKAKRSDFVVINDGDESHLRAQVDKILAELKKLPA